MKYRRLGKTGWDVSVLSLGLGHLTSLNGGDVNGREDRSIALIRTAIDSGINYLDLGYPYDEGEHKSRANIAGRALEGGYREKVVIAVTLPEQGIETTADFDRWLDRQLEWLGTERADFCLVGRLERDAWQRMLSLGMTTWADKALSDGRIGRLGFSFRDHYRILKTIVEGYDNWSFCQVSYNYIDPEHNPGTSGLNYAYSKDLGIVAANVLRGGKLAVVRSEAMDQLQAASKGKYSPAAWALRFAWNRPAVSTIVCDMTNMDELTENLRTAEDAVADSLSVEEEVAISRIEQAYRQVRPIRCPGCRPCMPCPRGISIPRLFEVYNDAIVYGDMEKARSICRDERLFPKECSECRLCEKRCTKLLPIINLLKTIKDELKLTPEPSSRKVRH